MLSSNFDLAAHEKNFNTLPPQIPLHLNTALNLSSLFTEHLICISLTLATDPQAAAGRMAQNRVDRGACIYNPSTLCIYDAYVLGFNMSFVWRCATGAILLPFFCENFSRRHLDMGVATGFFPSAALAQQRPTTLPAQEITLLDLSENSLGNAKARIAADNQTTPVSIIAVHGDVLAGVPPELKGSKFDSISMFNLLHCIPVPQETKNKAFELAADVLSDDGVLVGSSVLGIRYHAWWNPLGWVTMVLFNLVLGAFGNWGDEPAVFEQGLRKEFGDVKTWIVGSMFLFQARKPRRA
ncbi:hypothetical protein B0H67DRAFT_569295 [Lasiosphaeris hirsuta]|uniref:Methyltransferase type 12 domain-containing protein n=1 Tax=Lasiosphaeris hirsuta TaxID=260670 RepID=A0AA40AZU4_9PEZI|nr:hypothetical protein B0H67DRAFT_569295 [Lasiosphaeris hirsuta]